MILGGDSSLPAILPLIPKKIDFPPGFLRCPTFSAGLSVVVVATRSALNWSRMCFTKWNAVPMSSELAWKYLGNCSWLSDQQNKKHNSWLVVDLPTPLKNMSSSVGMMKFPTEWKNKKMFQTTNQILAEKKQKTKCNVMLKGIKY